MSRLWYVLLVCLLPHIYCLESKYEWRDYHGTIPEDAIVGGQNVDGDEIYIGQIEIDEQGTVVVEIFPGKASVEVIDRSGEIVETTNSSIKILCGPEQPVDWLRANNDNLHVVLIGRDAVIGGYEEGYLNVGRISYANEIRVGKITAYSTDGGARLRFIYKDKVYSSNVYEVLTFDMPRRPPRPRPPHRRGHMSHRHQ